MPDIDRSNESDGGDAAAHAAARSARDGGDGDADRKSVFDDRVSAQMSTLHRRRRRL